MGTWKARLMALLSMVAMLVAFSAPVALADNDDCVIREDRVVCDENGDREVFNENELDEALLGDDEFFLGDDEFFLLGADDVGDEIFEFEDIDCDGIDDDIDEFTDEGLCEVEGEFLGEDVEFLVEADEVFDEVFDF